MAKFYLQRWTRKGGAGIKELIIKDKTPALDTDKMKAIAKQTDKMGLGLGIRIRVYSCGN